MIRASKRIWSKIVAETSPENKLKGQLASLLAGVLFIIANDESMKDHLMLKSIIDFIATSCVLEARKRALKTK